MTERHNLGRGLSALFGEDNADYASLDRVRAAKEVPIEQLHPNAKQPRHRFDEAPLQELADSIARNGLLQPILVRRHPQRPAEYEIVAGERRWRAAQVARLHQVPVVIRDVDDAQALELALVENLQRQDLSPIEEAEAYQRLIAEFKHGQEELGRAIGKSRSYIANSLRLLGLPEAVKAMVDDGALSAGHARALIGSEAAEALAEEIVRRGLNVRQTEALVRERKAEAKPRKRKAKAAAKDVDTIALERDLSGLLGLKVSIDIRGRGGALTIHYQTLEQLDEVLQRLSHDPSQS